MVHGRGIIAPILVPVGDGGYGENVMKASVVRFGSTVETHSLSSPTGET